MVRRGLALVTLVTAVLTGPSSADAAEKLADIARQVRAEAKKWRADAELVQVDVSLIDFGVGPAPSQYPPPRAAVFSFLSPSAHQAIRIIADLNRDTRRTEYLSEPYSPFTSAIPSDVAMNVEQAIAQARTAVAMECASDNAVAVRSCTVVTGAELHMEDGRPTWTVQFGQNPRTLRSVSRAVDARTGRVLASQSNAARPDEATGVVPALQATVVGLRFFESAPPQPLTRNYDDLFFYNAARHIYWELHLVHPVPTRPTSFTLEEVWKGPGGDIAWRATRQFTVEAGWPSSYVFSSARLVGTKTVSQPNLFYSDCLRRQRERGSLEACSPTTGVDIEQWPRGAYEVDIVADNRLVATGVFSMRAKDDIYAEVRAKAAASRSAPLGFIRDLDAKVVRLKFFEAGATAPSGSQRSYRTQFSHAATRNVNWELDLTHPAPHRWLPLSIEALLFFRDAAGERVVQRKVLQSAVPADRTDTAHEDSFGWNDDYYYYRAGSTDPPPRQWMVGAYRVDLWVAGAKVASGTFDIR